MENTKEDLLKFKCSRFQTTQYINKTSTYEYQRGLKLPL